MNIVKCIAIVKYRKRAVRVDHPNGKKRVTTGIANRALEFVGSGHVKLLNYETTLDGRSIQWVDRDGQEILFKEVPWID